MKKNTLCLLIVSVFVAFAACKKKSDNSNAISYIVNGLTDVTVAQYVDTTFVMAVAVAYQSGTQEPVTLTPSNLPSGVTVTPATSSGTPGFATSFTFHINMTSSGTFAVTINASSASSGSKTFKFNVIVIPGVIFKYGITTLPDITIRPYIDTTISLPLSVSYMQGVKETITIAAISSSGKITVTPETNDGIPPFSTTFTLHSTITKPGTYPVTIQSSSASTGTQSFSFHIVVNPKSACDAEITGLYTGITTCSPKNFWNSWDGIARDEYVTSTGVTNEVIIPALLNLTATLNCTNGTLTTLKRTNTDNVINPATGTFTADTISINYPVFDWGGTLQATCKTVLTR